MQTQRLRNVPAVIVIVFDVAPVAKIFSSDMLFDEYTRLGQPLKDPSVTLTTIVDRVDIELSRMQTYVIQSADGPGGAKQFLCNQTAQASWWLPPGQKFSERIYIPLAHRRSS